MLRLTQEMRRELKKPFGPVLKGNEAVERIGKWNGMLIAIGDACVLFLLEHGIKPNIAIYDFKVMREELDEKSRKQIMGQWKKPVVVRNPPGFITDELRDTVVAALKRGEGRILVEGEEDLAALVGIENAGEGSLLIYGQPKKGIVFVEIAENVKERARLAMERMERI